MRPNLLQSIKSIDIFAMINMALFLVLCIFKYHARFIQYRGTANINEFFIYAIVILAAINTSSLATEVSF